VPAISVERLGIVGARVEGVDFDRLVNDDGVVCRHGVWVTRSTRRVGSVRAVVLAGICAAVVLAGCGGSGGTHVSGARRLELALGSAHRSRIPPALVAGALDPGRYSTTRLVPRITISLGQGWSLVNEAAGELTLSRGLLGTGTTQVRFVNLKRAWQIDPPFTADNESARDWIPRSRRAPLDYLSFVRSLSRYLDVGGATTMRVAGREVPALDYKVAHVPSSLSGTCFQQPGPCFAPPSGVRLDYVSLPLGSAVRIAVLPSRDGPLLVEVEAPDAQQLQALLVDVDPSFSTLEFG
jgi:hypothetical protein